VFSKESNSEAASHEVREQLLVNTTKLLSVLVAEKGFIVDFDRKKHYSSATRETWTFSGRCRRVGTRYTRRGRTLGLSSLSRERTGNVPIIHDGPVNEIGGARQVQRCARFIVFRGFCLVMSRVTTQSQHRDSHIPLQRGQSVAFDNASNGGVIIAPGTNME
jgi:hypothetical protein